MIDQLHQPLQDARPATPRRGHRRAIVALLLIAPAPTLGALMAFWLAPGTTLGGASYVLGKAWLYGFPLFWLLVVDRGRPSWSPPRHGGFGVAAMLALAISLIIWAAYLLYGRAQIHAETIRELTAANGMATPARYLAACAWLMVVNAALEEYAFRWFIYRQCEQIWPSLSAVIVSALIFAAHHVLVLRSFFAWDITLLGSAGVFAGGAIWSWCYRQYRSIWPGYVSHAIVDLAIFAVGWSLIFGA